MVRAFLLNPWFIGGSVTAVLWLCARFTDAEKAYVIGVDRGRWISKTMRATKLGAKAWEKIEDFLQRLVLSYVKGLMDGLDQDDGEADKEDAKPV